MKKVFTSLLLVALVLAVAVVPVMAMGNAQEGGEITNPVWLYVIGVAASGVVYGLKLLAQKYPQVVIKREWLTVGLYVISLGLAVYWGGVAIAPFPAFNDPLTFIAALFTFADALMKALAVPAAFATLIYNVLLKKVFDGLAVG